MDNKSSRFNNTLRLLFLFSFGAPAIFFILQKQTQRVLWRKFDNEYLKTLQVLLSNLFPQEDRTSNLQLHVTKYNDASKIIQVGEKEALEYLYNLNFFQKNGKFDRNTYNNFLKINGLVEPLLIKCTQEILTIQKYENFQYKERKKNNYGDLFNSKIKKIIKSIETSGKTIKYTAYFLKKDIIPIKKFSLKEKKEAYEQLKKKRKDFIFKPKQYQGILMTNDLKNYQIDVNEEEIKNYYIKNKEIYSNEENLHVFFLANPDKNYLKEITNKFHEGQLNLEDLKSQYNGQTQIFNSFKNKEFANFKNIATNIGNNRFIIQQIPNYGPVALAVIKEEKIPIDYNRIKPIIKENIKKQKLLDIINQDITMIQNNNGSKKYKSKPYTIKDKNDPHYNVKKNIFEIKDGQVIIFITQNIIPKKIIEFSEVEDMVEKYLQSKYEKNKINEILTETSRNLTQKKSINKENFKVKEGLIDLNNLYENFNISHLLLSSPRDLYFIHKNKNAIVYTTVQYNPKNNNPHQEYGKLLDLIENQEYTAHLKSKSYFAKSMFKHVNKIIVVIKDFWDTLVN